MGLNRSFWKGKRVFLTGHTGFKGAWAALWLESLGAQVHGYALAPQTEPSLHQALGFNKNQSFNFADIRDLETLKKRLLQSDPEIVIHMAAQPLVRDSYDDPVGTYSTNVMGTVHLLEAVRHCRTVRAVVNVTTDKCYENVAKPQGYVETDALGGYDPYSNSKACSELATSSYRSSFFNPEKYSSHHVGVATARAGNVIGGGDWSKDRLIPDIIRAIQRKEAVKIRSPKAIRPWQHVLEPIHGYLTLCERLWEQGPRYSEGFNFGPDENEVKDVSWVVDKIAEFWGPGVQVSIEASLEKHEAQILRLNCDKAKEVLKWKPLLSTEDAVRMTTEWYKKFYENKDMKKISLSQIESYERIISKT